MRSRHNSDIRDSLLAAGADAAAIAFGFVLATWIRFDSGWLPVPLGRAPDLYRQYASVILGGTLIFLLAFRSIGLYVRPQIGRFEYKIPRIVRACGLGLLGSMVLAFVLKNVVEFSTLALGLTFVTTSVLVVMERYILFRIELHDARHSRTVNRVLIVGTDPVAVRLRHSLEREPKLRTRVIGFLRTTEAPAAGLPAEMVVGEQRDLERQVAQCGGVDQIVVTDAGIGHDRIVEIILFCEREVIRFNMVPDLFRILTGSMDMQSIDDIPLLGVSQWPLDAFWPRFVKRAEDIVGALVGLTAGAPLMALAAIGIKATSPGPILYRQRRCGENGRPFTLYKLRTMRADAETRSGPVWTTPDDPRVTRIGRFLRRYNLDELPQFWNVLRGDMSLVGPRPERPHFVARFKEGIGRYMWRHVTKPGLTGWAQVNGLRGNTSVEERIRYDLYYLENWSLAFDFKILVKTFLTRENAY